MFILLNEFEVASSQEFVECMEYLSTPGTLVILLPAVNSSVGGACGYAFVMKSVPLYFLHLGRSIGNRLYIQYMFPTFRACKFIPSILDIRFGLVHCFRAVLASVWLQGRRIYRLQ